MNYIITDSNDLITGFVGIGGKPESPEGYSAYELFYGDIPVQARENLACYKYDGHTFEKMPDAFVKQCHIDEIRETKIQAMSRLCNTSIVYGIDIGDDHYSLTVEDQMNITRLGMKAEDPNNTDTLIYHPDNKPLRVYTKEEMLYLYHKSSAWIDYNEIYFNLLKQWITVLEYATDIIPINYNDELPPGYREELEELIDISSYDFNIMVITDSTDYDNIIPVIDARPSIELYKQMMTEKEEKIRAEVFHNGPNA